MARAKGINGELHCSFCGKRGAEVRRLIAGPGVCICDECIAACRHSLGDVRDVAPAGARPIGTRTMAFRNCGRSGLKLPAIGLGVGRNFGGGCDLDEVARIVSRALDFGIVHFDAANVYGSPAGSAEENLGETLKRLRVDRQELIISTKAGSRVGRGPYQRGSSRKSLVASLNRSLQRLDLPYVDIFYSHQRDPETPLEETAAAFEQLVRQGKTLYVGISNYSVADTREMARLLRELGTPLVSQQPPYSIFDREAEAGLMPLAEEQGFGLVVYSPLARGLLTGKYNEAVPTDSMEAQHPGALGVELDDALRAKLKALNDLAVQRGQTIGQMALTWVLREPRVSCALIGARTVEQLEENATALAGAPLSAEELQRIDDILAA